MHPQTTSPSFTQSQPAEWHGHAICGIDDALREHLSIDDSRQLPIRGELTNQDPLINTRDNVGDARVIRDKHRTPDAVLNQDVEARFKVGDPAIVQVANGRGGWTIGTWRRIQPNRQPAVKFQLRKPSIKQRIDVASPMPSQIRVDRMTWWLQFLTVPHHPRTPH